jgi:transcriptional regulator with PAS, ATPase and Fis domain
MFRHVAQALSPSHLADEHRLAGIFGPGTGELAASLVRAIPQGTTLLLTGETGTGKTRLAREIHALSPRRDEPFVEVNCGALSPHLIESEMFGHAQGAFTGADCDRVGKITSAGRGTLLLDEIDVLTPALQGKLLRAVDDRLFEPVGSNTPLPLEARLIVISSVPLAQEVAAGRFRADLYFRLNIIAFHLPPLRERPGATAHLARRFVAEFAGRNRCNIRGLSPQALAALESYGWPGNVRELQNVIERAAALAPGPELKITDLPASVCHCSTRPVPTPILPGQAGVTPEPPLSSADCLTLTECKEQVEILRITEALRKHRNNRLRAAADLGISRMSLYKKLHKYGLIKTG